MREETRHCDVCGEEVAVRSLSNFTVQGKLSFRFSLTASRHYQWHGDIQGDFVEPADLCDRDWLRVLEAAVAQLVEAEAAQMKETA